MELLLVLVFTTIITGISMLPLVVGFSKIQPGQVFLGMTHHPQDYYYYLSQFAQGKESWLWGRDLFTTDFPQRTFVGWTNILLGRLWSSVGVPPMWAYHLSTIVLTFLLFIVAYRIFCEIFPQKSTWFIRIIALIFFIFGNVWPGNTFWQNFIEPLVRVSSVPHQIIIQIAILATLLISQTKLLDKDKRIKITLLVVLGLVLGSTNPIQWALVASVLILTGSVLPGLIFIGAGLPMVFYLSTLFQNAPYVQLKIWELAQQVHLTPWAFVLSQGPLALGALVGVVSFLKLKNSLGISIVLYTLLSLLLFLSPIPEKFGISNVRALSSVPSLAYAVISAYLLWTIPKAIAKFAIPIILLLFLLVSLPVFYVQMKEKLAQYDPVNSYLYIPKDVYALFQKAHDISTINDNFLVRWPYNISFPGVASRPEYNAHPLLTIEFKKKDDLAWKYMSRQLSQEEMKSFLVDNNIQYIIDYPQDYQGSSLPVTLVEDNCGICLFKVTIQ